MGTQAKKLAKKAIESAIEEMKWAGELLKAETSDKVPLSIVDHLTEATAHMKRATDLAT